MSRRVDPRVTARTNNPDTTPLVCVCGDAWACPGCGVCLNCVASTRCDVDGRHCEPCIDGCAPCQKERRP